MFDNNFGKCGPIFKIFSPSHSYENTPCALQRFPPHLQYVATLPCQVENPKMLLTLTASRQQMLTCS